MMEISEMKAGRELDALVAELMGKPFRKPTHGTCCTCQVCGWDYDNCQCNYGEFIDKALLVVEKMRNMPGFVEIIHDGMMWVVTFENGHKGIGSDFELPLAICRAALKAVE